MKGLLQGQHNIPLVVKLEPPQVPDDATAQSLGITGLVSDQPVISVVPAGLASRISRRPPNGFMACSFRRMRPSR